jgi:HPt (histidine-containing phosphotransfer) domain-containing protein
LLKKFVDNQADAVHAIRSARSENDNEAAVRHAHTLKGVAGAIGAGNLQASAAKLEAELKKESGESLEPLLAETESELSSILQPLAKLFESSDAVDDTSPGKLPDDFADQLRDLKSLIEEYDAEAVDALESLMSKVRGTESYHDLSAVKKHLDGYDFDAAAEVLEPLIEARCT